MGEQISNYGVYLARMEASLQEKLYFIQYLHRDITTFVDFGCADGVLLGVLGEMYPSASLVGIDNDETMLSLTESRLGGRVKLYKSLDAYKMAVHKRERSKSVLILSSVVHELFSYLSRQEYEAEIYKMFHCGFKQVCIRDMAVRKSLYLEAATVGDIEKIELHPFYADYVNKIGHEVCTKQELYHFLLKYRYEDNWSRELQENYLMFSYEDLLYYFGSVASGYYKIDYRLHELLDYTRGVVAADFGIDMVENTNYKLVFTKRGRQG